VRTPAELESAEELLTRRQVPSEREGCGGPLRTLWWWWTPRCGRRPTPGVFRDDGRDRARQRELEQLYVALARLYGHEGDLVVLARLADPRVQQQRLPAAGGRRDDRYRFPATRSRMATRSWRWISPCTAAPTAGPTNGRHVGHRAISSGHPVGL